MRPIGFLMCLGKAIVRHLGAVVGLGCETDLAVQVVQEIWDDWRKQNDSDARRAELKAIVEQALDDFCNQAAEVVQEVAGTLNAFAQHQLAISLYRTIDLLRLSLERTGESDSAPSLPETFDVASLQSVPVSIPHVKLIQVAGPLKGRVLIFDRPGPAIIGRGSGCCPAFPSNCDHETISRRHCVLDIDPPTIRVRDLGSMAGTYVNGKRIGKRNKAPGHSDSEFPGCSLKNGDELQLCQRGVAVFHVGVSVDSDDFGMDRSKAHQAPLRCRARG